MSPSIVQSRGTCRGQKPGARSLASSVVSWTLARCQSMKVLSSFSSAQLFLRQARHVFRGRHSSSCSKCLD